MTIKATVHEKCEMCGGRTARKVGDTITRFPHRCAGAPPGPAGAFQRFNIAAVTFVPGDFTPEQYRAELDEAWEIITDLRQKRHLAETNAKAAVEKAIRDTYN